MKLRALLDILPGNLLGLLPIIGQVLGLLFQKSAADRAQALADRRSALEEEVMREYLEDYRFSRPYRRYVIEQGGKRAGQRPFYSAVWGRYGPISIDPFVPPPADGRKPGAPTVGGSITVGR